MSSKSRYNPGKLRVAQSPEKEKERRELETAWVTFHSVYANRINAIEAQLTEDVKIYGFILPDNQARADALREEIKADPRTDERIKYHLFGADEEQKENA